MNVNTIPEIDCCGCGTCVSLCPTSAIKMQISSDGELTPGVDPDKCVGCQVCANCCPQNRFIYKMYEGFVSENPFLGNAMSCYNVQSKNKKLLENSASGGFVTDLIYHLLKDKEYDCAFLVDGYSYGDCVKTTKISDEEKVKNAAKSKYVQISHEEEVKYILKNRNERVILVGTPCFFHGFLKVIDKYKLNRQNYLLIGLFCDSTMTQHIWEYFALEKFGYGELESLFFRDKKNGGWPGNVSLVKNGTIHNFSNFERMNAKKYFMPESCLYCLDKLNMFADFSVGDNYLGGKLYSKKGSSSIIIRTPRANEIWDKEKDIFIYEKIGLEELGKSQKISDRAINATFYSIKHNGMLDDSFGIPAVNNENIDKYQLKMKYIQMGRDGEYEKIYSEGARQRKRINFILYKIASYFVNCYRMKKKQKCK